MKTILLERMREVEEEKIFFKKFYFERQVELVNFIGKRAARLTSWPPPPLMISTVALALEPIAQSPRGSVFRKDLRSSVHNAQVKANS